MTSYVHPYKHSFCIPEELKSFVHGNGIVCNRTTAYNPQSKGHVKRFNGIPWKTIVLATQSRNVPFSQWETVFPNALNSFWAML